MVNIETKRKVLLITYDFFPDGSANSHRWYNIIKKWKEKDVQVFVISANKNQYVGYEEVEGIKIYRTGEFFIGKLKYDKRDSGDKKRGEEELSTQAYAKTSFVRKLYNFTWAKLYWPDYAFLWRYTAYPLALKLIKDEEIDKIITVSWMFTAHLIGLKLKKKFKHIFWLSDTIDPFSLSNKINNIKLFGKWNDEVEKKVFMNSDVNSVLTERIRKEYINKFSLNHNKIIINKNIFLPGSFNFDKDPIVKDDGILKLVFLGTLSEETRSPKNLLILIDRIYNKYPELNAEFHFYGDFTNSLAVFREYSHLLDRIVFLNKKVTKNEVSLIMKRADVLINIGNSNPYQEPSKVIEYISSGKRILNVCAIEDDTSAELLKSYPLHINVFPKELVSNDKLDNVTNFLLGNATVDRKLIDELVKEYLVDNVADSYYNTMFT